VTYRDDHEAAIARAEALEREAAELREKAQRLEIENERLAADRARLIEQVEAPRRALARRAGVEDEAILARQEPGRLVSGALHAHTGLAIGAGAMPLVLMTALIALTGASFMLLLLALLAGAGGGLLVLGRFIEADEQRERKLLAELPLPLDVPAYLELLDRPHRSPATLTVEVEFEAMPDEVAVIENAVHAGAPNCTVQIAGAVLTIHSPALDTRSAKQPDNVELHRWFRRLVARALLPIAAVHPIAKLTVRS
jgi:hypothetical protein